MAELAVVEDEVDYFTKKYFQSIFIFFFRSQVQGVLEVICLSRKRKR